MANTYQEQTRIEVAANVMLVIMINIEHMILKIWIMKWGFKLLHCQTSLSEYCSGKPQQVLNKYLFCTHILVCHTQVNTYPPGRQLKWLLDYQAGLLK